MKYIVVAITILLTLTSLDIRALHNDSPPGSHVDSINSSRIDKTTTNQPFNIIKELEDWDETGGTYKGFRTYATGQITAINFNQSGDFADYSINLSKGTYQVSIRAGTPIQGNQTNVQFHFDGCSISTSPIKTTGSWDKFADNKITSKLVVATSGVHHFRIVGWGKPAVWQWNADSILFTKISEADSQTTSCKHPPELPAKVGLSIGGSATAYALVCSVIVFILSFFAAFILSIKLGEDKRHKLFAVFLLSIALSYLDGALISIQTALPFNLYVYGQFGMIFDFFFGPILLLYIFSAIDGDYQLNRKQFLHLVPCFSYFLFIIYNTLDYSVSLEGGDSKPLFSNHELITLSCLSSLHMTCYLIAIIKAIINQYKNSDNKNIFNNYPYSNWLTISTSILCFTVALRLADNIWTLTTPTSPYLQLKELKLLAATGVLIATCIFLFRSLQESIFNSANNKNKKEQYKIDEKATSIIANLISNYMTSEKPWMSGSFDLKALSDGIKTPSYQVSQTINQQFEMNFFDYINSFKVKESQRLLADPENKDQTIIELMYNAGFNSKSTFNAAFKKLTGMTPSQYRKKVLLSGYEKQNSNNALKANT